MLKRWLTATAIALCFTSAVVPAYADEPGSGVSCGRNGCTEHASDSSHSDGVAGDGGGGSSSAVDLASSSNGATTSAPDPCAYRPLPTQPAAGSPLWEGNDPASGKVEYTPCLQLPDGSPSGAPLYRFTATPATGPAPAAPQVSAVDLAQQASQQIPIPSPVMNFGPNPDEVAVKVPVWMWVDRVDPAPLTVTAGTVSVTATARLQSVSWSMGDPVDPSNLAKLAEPVVCAGDSMYMDPTDFAAGTESSCSYTYIWKSTADRTAGAEKWPITATATWTISWTASTGESGQITAPAAVATTALRVGQWTAVGVPGPAG